MRVVCDGSARVLLANDNLPVVQAMWTLHHVVYVVRNQCDLARWTRQIVGYVV